MASSFSEVIGYMAAACTTLSFVPQALQVMKTRNTNAISRGMYIVFVTGTWLWFAYGILSQSWPVTLANLITGVLASVILYWKIRYG